MKSKTSKLYQQLPHRPIKFARPQALTIQPMLSDTIFPLSKDHTRETSMKTKDHTGLRKTDRTALSSTSQTTQLDLTTLTTVHTIVIRRMGSRKNISAKSGSTNLALIKCLGNQLKTSLMKSLKM